jgi:hypothetical protein
MVRASRSVAQMVRVPTLLVKGRTSICNIDTVHRTFVRIKFCYILCLGHQVCEVVDGSFGIRILEDDPANIIAELKGVEVHHFNLDAEGAGPRLHAGDGLRVQLV